MGSCPDTDIDPVALQSISIKFRKTETKLIPTVNQNKESITKGPGELKVTTSII